MWLSTGEGSVWLWAVLQFFSSFKKIVGRYSAVKKRGEIEVNGMNPLLSASSIQSQNFINYLFDILNIYVLTSTYLVLVCTGKELARSFKETTEIQKEEDFFCVISWLKELRLHSRTCGISRLMGKSLDGVTQNLFTKLWQLILKLSPRQIILTAKKKVQIWVCKKKWNGGIN